MAHVVSAPRGRRLHGRRSGAWIRGWTPDHVNRSQGLYEAEGYVAVDNFNGNPVATFFGEKRSG